MYVKKIVAKNFILPGVQIFEFDKNFGLIDGKYDSLEVLPVIHEFLNGGWTDYTTSLEKFYPKFNKRVNDMDMELDVLIEFTEEELVNLNDILFKNDFKRTKYTSWFYSIKAYYPYIFPIVTISPASDSANRSKESLFGVGDHYSKFLNSNLSKRNLLAVCAFYCISQFREEYYNYSMMDMDEESFQLHQKYLGLIKSVFRYDENFMKKIGKLFYQIDDGDVLNYGDQEEYFYRHELIKKWYDSIEVLKESEEIRRDFSHLLWKHLFSNLQFAYAIKSANETIDIRKILVDSNCIRTLNFSDISKMFKIPALEAEPVEEFEEANFDKPEIVEKEIKSPLDLLEKEKEKVINSNLMDLVDHFEVLDETQDQIIEKVEDLVVSKKEIDPKHKTKELEKFQTLTQTVDSDNLTEWN